MCFTSCLFILEKSMSLPLLLLVMDKIVGQTELHSLVRATSFREEKGSEFKIRGVQNILFSLSVLQKSSALLIDYLHIAKFQIYWCHWWQRMNIISLFIYCSDKNLYNGNFTYMYAYLFLIVKECMSCMCICILTKYFI